MGIDALVFSAGVLFGLAVALIAAFIIRRATQTRMDRLAAAILRAVQREEARTLTAVHHLTYAVAAGDQAWYWTPKWQQMEREADEAISAGRTVGPMSPDEFEAYLDRLDAEAEAEQRAHA